MKELLLYKEEEELQNLQDYHKTEAAIRIMLAFCVCLF